jgi:hypothetical protein
MTSPHPGPDQRADPEGREAGPHWQIRVCRTGSLTAALTGSEPPIIVTATDHASLRRQIQALICYALL